MDQRLRLPRPRPDAPLESARLSLKARPHDGDDTVALRRPRLGCRILADLGCAAQLDHAGAATREVDCVIVPARHMKLSPDLPRDLEHTVLARGTEELDVRNPARPIDKRHAMAHDRLDERWAHGPRLDQDAILRGCSRQEKPTEERQCARTQQRNHEAKRSHGSPPRTARSARLASSRQTIISTVSPTRRRPSDSWK